MVTNPAISCRLLYWEEINHDEITNLVNIVWFTFSNNLHSKSKSKNHHQLIQAVTFSEWLSARFKGCKGDLQCLGIKFGHDLKLGKELHRIHGHPNGDETPCAEALGVFFSGRTQKCCIFGCIGIGVGVVK